MRYRFDPLVPPARRTAAAGDSAMRASDAERNDVADRLSRHFADGRLDEAEFKRRLDTAMAATTRGDLRGLFDDLPPLASEQPAEPTRRRRALPVLWTAALVAVVLATGLAMLHAVHVPWLLVLAVVVVLWHRAGRRRHVHHHVHPFPSGHHRMDDAA